MYAGELEFTVIVPTYNRISILQKCLEALTLQTFPADNFEIIVSDDGSTDETLEGIKRFLKNDKNHIRYISQNNSGANAARNRAVLVSKGRILLFINDDTVSSQTMIEEHKRVHQQYNSENVAVLGRMTIAPEVPYSLFSKLHLDANFGLWEGRRELDWQAFYTCNVSVKRSFLMKYGLFEEKMRYHEDLELSERLSHYGLKVIYNPEALGYHFHELREEDYLNIARREGKALSVWYEKSPHLKKKLACIGYYLELPLIRRTKYIAADLLVNRFSIPFFLVLARYYSLRNESIALLLYRKIYQAIKRETIREERHNVDKSSEN